jgi:pyruvate kinase
MSAGASKTKIVATIGPASQARATLEQMIEAGMSVARLNFAHGDFAGHGATIRTIRAAAAARGRRVAIMADLPGPKLRIGRLAQSPVEPEHGRKFTLSVGEQVAGQDVQTAVAAGGPLLSNKGINLPEVDLGIGAFTQRDKACLEFALSQGVDAIGQSFVQTPTTSPRSGRQGARRRRRAHRRA